VGRGWTLLLSVGEKPDERIVNYFDHRQANAEAITNKIKVMKLRGSGHDNPHRYRRKVLLSIYR
jgi:transposase